MNRWFLTLALAGLLCPLALGGDGEESNRPSAPKAGPDGRCAAKPEKADRSACQSACARCAVPEDERQAYLELLDIIRTTDSPDTFTAAVAGLVGADGAAEKRYARLAVPVVIRNAERLGLLKGIASAQQPTPAQAGLLDYLAGAAAEAPPAPAMAESYGVPSRGRSNQATGMYPNTPSPMPPAWPYAPCCTVPLPTPPTGPASVPPTMSPAVEGQSGPATNPPAAIAVPPRAARAKDNPPTPERAP